MANDIYVSFGAETGGLESAFALSKAQAASFGREVANMAREIVRAGDSADAALVQKLGAVSAELSEAKNRAKEFSDQLREQAAAGKEGLLSLENLHEGFEKLLEIAGITVGIDAFKEWISGASEAAEKVERLSAILGASTNEIQQIQSVAKLTGTDFDQMAHQLERLQLGLAKSESAAAPARAALAALGIEADKFRQLPIPEQLDALAAAFSRFADGPNKTAAAVALLGKAGADMIPYLDRGRAAINEMEEAAEKAGAVLSQNTVEALAATKEHTAELDLAVEGLSNQLLSQLNPAIDASIGFLTRITSAFTQASRAANDMNVAIPEALRQGRLSLGDLPFVNASSGNIPALDPNGDALRQAIAGGRSLTVHGKPQVPALDLGGGRGGGGGGGSDKEASQEAIESYNEQVDAARDAAKETLDSLNNEVRTHKISWDEWAKDLVAALETEKAAIQAAADTAVKSAEITGIEKQRIARETANEIAHLAREEADDQAKAAEETMKAWNNFFTPFNSAIDKNINSLIIRP